MNAGHFTRRQMKYSDVESDVCTDSYDDEVEVVNSRSNALDVKQTPCLKGSRESPPFLYNSNYHPISYLFGDIAAYCSNFRHFAFLSHPLGA